MINAQITNRESLAINIMKAFSIFSVIAAHVVSVSHINLFSQLVSSFWALFGEVGVIVFFVIGGFLYTRKPHDNTIFWKKKFVRIIVPWLVCSCVTYVLAGILSHSFSVAAYFKWILGSGTWYYYVVIYLLFLLIFKWFYNKDVVLYILLGMQTLSLILASFGMSTTISLDFFTDYLNPLHWVGYFSLGILIRKHRWDIVVRKQKAFIAISYILAILSFCLLLYKEIFTYFHIVSSVFCLSALVIIADISYKIAATGMAKRLGKIGSWSYCIYLLHMPIVQPVISRIPHSTLKFVFSPFIGLGIMIIIIGAGLFICSKLPFGEKIKKLIGL